MQIHYKCISSSSGVFSRLPISLEEYIVYSEMGYDGDYGLEFLDECG